MVHAKLVRLMPRFRFLAIAALSVLAAARSSAQVLRGVVNDPSDRPIAGAVVQLLDSANALAGRTLTNQRGEYLVTAPRPGSYRVRTLRIGFRPVMSEEIRLAAGQDLTRRIAFTGLSFSLDTMRVASRNSCHMAADSGAAVYSAWEQVRTALSAAQATGDARISATTIAYERAIDPATWQVMRQNQLVGSAYVNQPWLSESPDSLRRSGYVRLMPDLATTYYAPGLDALLDASFVEDHCFHLVSERARVGLAFEPAPHRSAVPEIRGTLWIDRNSSQLRALEFGYANVSKPQEERAGGDLSFVAMRDGTWAISQWNIRMPVLEESVASTTTNAGTAARITGGRLVGMIAAGGELVKAQRGNDTIYMQPPRTLRGVVVDSLTGAASVGAYVTLDGTLAQAVSDSSGVFTMRGVLPGVYSLNVNTPSLDSVNAQHRTSVSFDGSSGPIRVLVPGAQRVAATLCGAAPLPNPGIVLGHLSVKGDSAPPRDVRVLAEWMTAQEGTVGPRTSRMESKVDGQGTFRFCGVPTSIAVKLRTESDSGVSAPTLLTIPSETPFTRAEAEFEWQAQLGATFSGVVLADSSMQPIAGAEVIFPLLGKAAITNDAGVFRIPDIPFGTHRLSVRRFGYIPIDDSLPFTSRAGEQRRIVLGKSATLGAIVTTERAIPASFDEHRRTSMGAFVVRDELEKFAGRSLGSLMESKRGVNLVHGNGGHAWVQSKRGPASFCSTADCMRREKKFYIPTKAETSIGMAVGCYMQVYLDRVLANSGQPTEPFDLNTLAPELIEGIEIYASEAETPTEYRGRGAQCGVVVVWSRTHK